MVEEKELDRPDIIIEGSTAKWDLRIEGDIHGTYSGQFRFRCYLTPTQRLAASREYRALLGDNPALAPVHEDNLAYSLSQLKYRILSAPPFWTATVQGSNYAGDIPDENVIDAVLNAAVTAELKYKLDLKKRKTESIDRAKKAAERLLKAQDDEDAEVKEDDGES